jgi:hypothetical protein
MADEDAVDWARVEDYALALMHLTTFPDKVNGYRSWKGLDWHVLDRLHQRGWISNPATKAKSVVVSQEGQKRSRELFERHFLKNLRRGTPR